jgi:NitT/TauT family transport system substrate-binding protein
MLEYFHPWTNSAGFYLARDRGWYDEQGLEVEIVVPDPDRGDTLAHIERSDVDFGVFPSNRLLVRRDRGEALLAVAAVNHRALETVQTVVATGIRRPRDLAGRRVALNPTPRGIALLRHLVRQDGGDPDRLIVVDSGVREFTPEQMAAGEVDASFGSYWAWEILMDSRVPAEERIVWPVDEIGAPPYHSYLLGGRADRIAAMAETTRRFLAATSRGFLAAAADPLAVVPIYERVIPYFPRELIVRSLPRIAPTWLHEGRWGWQREDLLQPYAAWLAEHGIVADAEVWRRAFSNDYLPEGRP